MISVPRPRRSTLTARSHGRAGRALTLGRDRGAADALGLVLIAPAVVGLAILVVALGRGVDARAQVRTAAEAAAQAAALERNGSDAARAGVAVAAAMLTDEDACAEPQIDVVYPALASPAGTDAVVAVTVTCYVSDRGIAVVKPGARMERATAYATLDPFRAERGP